jgi:flagellar biosynthesis component FlhA
MDITLTLALQLIFTVMLLALAVVSTRIVWSRGWRRSAPRNPPYPVVFTIWVIQVVLTLILAAWCWG